MKDIVGKNMSQSHETNFLTSLHVSWKQKSTN